MTSWPEPCEPLTLLIPCKGADCVGANRLARHARARELRRLISTVLVINDRGYGEALKLGLRAANTPWVATMDADGQHTLDGLLCLLEHAPQADMTIGIRARGWGSRDVASRLLNAAASIVVGQPVPDFGSGLRVIRREWALELLERLPDGFDFNAMLTLGFLLHHRRVQWVPIQVYDRDTGRSHVTWTDGLTTLKSVLLARRRLK